MKNINITPITKHLSVRFSNRSVQLPRAVQEKVDAYWDAQIVSGKCYTRGEVFTVTQKSVSDEEINILVEKTDYAHYLYCQNVDNLGSGGVHIIHTAALVETADDYYIVGVMGPQTARSGIIQLCGGGIDNGDLRGDVFDLTHNIAKELSEELDIDVADTSRVALFEEAFFKEGGPTDKMTVVYRVVLNDTRDAFFKKYTRFVERLTARGALPEFGEVIALKKNKKDSARFFAHEDRVFDEYMKPLFEHISAGL